MRRIAILTVIFAIAGGIAPLPGSGGVVGATEPKVTPPAVDQMYGYPMMPYGMPIHGAYPMPAYSGGLPIQTMPAAVAYPAYTAPASTISASTPAITVSQTGNSVHIVDFAFNLSSLSVPAGTTVAWTNSGMATHTTTSDTGAWNSGPLRPGATFSQSFTTAGTFTYHCMIHPNMMGSVTVTAGSGVSAVAPVTSTTPAQNNATATGPAMTVSYAAGWNIVSAPAGATLSGNSGPLYTFRAGDSAYEVLPASTPLAAGVGYWSLFAATTTQTYPAAPAQPATVQLPAGQFVLVGNSTNGNVTPTGADAAFTYDPVGQQYQSVTVLKAGQGAWAFSTAGAVVTMTPA